MLLMVDRSVQPQAAALAVLGPAAVVLTELYSPPVRKTSPGERLCAWYSKPAKPLEPARFLKPLQRCSGL
jgi:hypothetical protein